MPVHDLPPPAPQDETHPYRAWLRRHGFVFRSTRHTERSRSRATAGQLTAGYTVTLTWPGGRVSRHTAPDRLSLAYSAACAACGIGQPPAQQAAEDPARQGSLF